MCACPYVYVCICAMRVRVCVCVCVFSVCVGLRACVREGGYVGTCLCVWEAGHILLKYRSRRTHTRLPLSGPEVQCPDIVIVGGGLAGAYAAWRLREINQSIVLFEKSSRLGGRIYTHTATGYSRPWELGSSFFLPSVHPQLNNLVKTLGLDTETFVSGRPAAPPVNYLRGEFIENEALCQETCPYKLREQEKNKSPVNLLR